MSIAGQSFLTSEQLNERDIDLIFSRAQLFKNEFAKKKRFDHLLKNSENMSQRALAWVFAEPSTRTRLSFQIAASRLGMRSFGIDDPKMASLSKGETLEDTFRVIAAMQPDLMVVRYDQDTEADAALKDLPCMLINGGIGTLEHPTQALLDAFTILSERGQIRGEKVLIVGDVLHSRVANSNLNLLKRLGAEVAYCAPAEFIPKNDTWKQVQSFGNLKEAVEWATVVMGLRVQKERHQAANVGFSMAEYRERYRIGGDQLKHFRADGVLMHPGPVIQGVEFSSFVMRDSRCKVLNQVTNGVFIRASLMSLMLDLEVQTT